MVSVGAIINGAFSLPLQRPGAVAAWSLLYSATTVANGWLVQGSGFNDGTVPPLDYLAGFVLLQLATVLLAVVLTAAALRAALRPQDSDFASIRLGMDELRLLGLTFLLTLAFYAGIIVLALPLGFFLVTRADAMGEAGIITISLIWFLLILVGAVWLYVRLSLAVPLTFLRGKIIIGQSWALTRGRFWPLFGGYLVVALFLLALWGVASAVAAVPLLTELMGSGFDAEAMDAVAQRQMSQVNAMTVLGWLVGGLVGGVAIAMISGAIAAATRLLGADRDELADTFA